MRSDAAFALIDFDVNGGLAGEDSIEYLTLLHGHSRIAPDQGHKVIVGDASPPKSGGLDAQGEGGHVHQNGVDLLSGHDTRLHSRAQSHRRVRVDLAVGFPPQMIGDQRPDRGDTGGAAHQQYPVQIVRLQFGIGQGLVDGVKRAVQQFTDQPLKLRPLDLPLDVQRAALFVCGNIFQVDSGVGCGRKFDFGFFGCP